jgi:hypothetical protein
MFIYLWFVLPPTSICLRNKRLLTITVVLADALRMAFVLRLLMNEVHMEWRKVIDHIENGRKRVQMCVGSGEGILIFKELEEVLGLPVDPYTPPVPPWT